MQQFFFEFFFKKKNPASMPAGSRITEILIFIL
jgi:hypothetical protein